MDISKHMTFIGVPFPPPEQKSTMILKLIGSYEKLRILFGDHYNSMIDDLWEAWDEEMRGKSPK